MLEVLLDLAELHFFTEDHSQVVKFVASTAARNAPSLKKLAVISWKTDIHLLGDAMVELDKHRYSLGLGLKLCRIKLHNSVLYRDCRYRGEDGDTGTAVGEMASGIPAPR